MKIKKFVSEKFAYSSEKYTLVEENHYNIKRRQNPIDKLRRVKEILKEDIMVGAQKRPGLLAYTPAWSGREMPSFNIYLLKDGKVHDENLLCFVEYNPEYPTGREICIGAYRSNEADTAYYGSYFQSEGEKEKWLK